MVPTNANLNDAMNQNNIKQYPNNIYICASIGASEQMISITYNITINSHTLQKASATLTDSRFPIILR